MAAADFAKTILDGVDDLNELLLFYGERRHEDHDVAQRTNEDATIAGGHTDSPTDGVG